MAEKQIVETPTSDSSNTYEQLGYVEARDAVLHGEYAFAAYKETNRSSGEWCVRIKSHQTAGAVFDPKTIERQALTTSENGKPYFIWGYNFEPSNGDPRQIEFRVHVTDSKPSEIEMFVRTRKADHSPAEPKSVRFKWPTP